MIKKISKEAQELLERIQSISSHNLLAGQHNFPNTISQFSDKAALITGKYPALWGQDFGFSTGDDIDSILARQKVIDEAIRQYSLGSVITLMWHAVRPIEDEPVTFKECIQGTVSDSEWKDILTLGTELHGRWQAQVDVIAGYLAQLKDVNIPVLWRPYHEMNGDWFWWGNKRGEYGYERLWRQLHDRLTNHWKLDNLIWVWNGNAPTSENIGEYADFYPGHDVVDILATDIYRNNYQQRFYEELVDLAEGKPVAIGECGEAPTSEILDKQPKWAWFMIWTGAVTSSNTPESLTAIYNDPRVLTRPTFK
jgi:mannan endo-1,4-beta-mannosidase